MQLFVYHINETDFRRMLGVMVGAAHGRRPHVTEKEKEN